LRDRKRRGERDPRRRRPRGGVARLDPNGLRDARGGRRPPGPRGGHPHRDVPGCWASAYVHGARQGPRERPDDPRCHGHGPERDERHGALEHEPAGHHGGPPFPPGLEASYEAGLAANGWTHSLWRIADQGLPDLTVLQARRAVLWQVGLEQYPPFDAAERDLVKRYLDGGGRLIVASHDAAWALSDSNSSFASPESAAWVQGVLKARFVCDPSSIARANGVPSDPISGAYPGGVLYTPHRTGGADDELAAISAGGPTTTMWTDDGSVLGCSPANAPIGLRWISSARNGSAGVGVWGGNYSRLASFAFEITGLDTNATDLRPASPTRAAILDGTLRWLMSTAASGLDRDHPDVALTAPNGG